MGNLAAAGPSAFLDYKVDNADSLTTKLIEKREWKLLLKLIQDNPSEASKKDKTHGRLPLHRALIHGAPIQMVETLIKFYPHALQTSDNLDNCPIYYAIVNNVNYSVFLLMFSYNTDCLRKGDKDGHLPLHNALTRKMNENTLLLFVNNYPESALKRTRQGKHALHYACEFNAAASVVKAILSVNPSDVSRSNKLLSVSPKQSSTQNLVIFTSEKSLKQIDNLETESSPRESATNTAADGVNNYDESVTRQSISAPADSPTTPSSNNHTNNNSQDDDDESRVCSERSERSEREESQEVSSKLLQAAMGPALSAQTTPRQTQPGNNNKTVLTIENFTNTLAQDFYQSKLPLHIACEHKASLGVVSLLIEAYPEAVSILGSDSMYPLHYALCSKNSLEVVTALTTRCPEHLTHRDRRGRMPLHYGLEKGCSEAVLLFLLQTQPLVASYRGYGAPGNYPLSTAIEKHCSTLVLVTLIQAFTPAVREVNLNNVLPLQSAVKHKCEIEVIQLLLTTHPAAADVTDSYNRTSLHYAISRNNPLRYVEDLISAGPYCTSHQDNNGQIPLHLAVLRQVDRQLVECLITHYPEGLMCVDKYNHIPLNYAIEVNAPLWLIELILSVCPDCAKHVYDSNKIVTQQNNVNINTNGANNTNNNSYVSLTTHLNNTKKAEQLLNPVIFGSKSTPNLLTKNSTNKNKTPIAAPAAPSHYKRMKEIDARTNTDPFATDSLLYIDQYVEYDTNNNTNNNSTLNSAYNSHNNSFRVDKPQSLYSVTQQQIDAENSTFQGKLPLHQAIEFRRSFDIINALIQCYPTATYYTEGAKHRLPLHYAIERLMPLSVLLLIHEANPIHAVAVADCNGLLPIHYAILHHTDSEIVRVLLAVFPHIATCIDFPLHINYIVPDLSFIEHYAQNNTRYNSSVDLLNNNNIPNSPINSHTITQNNSFSLSNNNSNNNSFSGGSIQNLMHNTTESIEGMDDDDISLQSTSHNNNNYTQNNTNNNKPLKSVYSTKHLMINKVITDNMRNAGILSTDGVERIFSPENSTFVHENSSFEENKPIFDPFRRHVNHFLLLYYAIDHNATVECIAEILLYTMPYSHITGQLNLNHYFTWTYVTAFTQDVYSQSIEIVLRHYEHDRNVIKLLSDFPDLHTHRTIDIATTKCHFAILRRLYFYSRYEILTTRNIIHQNNNTLIVYALDHEATQNKTLNNTINNTQNNNKNTVGHEPNYNNKEIVVLKFTKNKTLFLHEIFIRENFDFSAEYIVPLIAHYNGDTNEKFRIECEIKGFIDYSYLLVFKAAQRSLQSIILHENICVNTQHLVKHNQSENAPQNPLFIDTINNPFSLTTGEYSQTLKFGRMLLTTVDYFHSLGLVHGDIKPSNLLRVSPHFLSLSDLGVTRQYSMSELVSGSENVCYGYMPPELATMYLFALKHERLTRQQEEQLTTSREMCGGEGGDFGEIIGTGKISSSRPGTSAKNRPFNNTNTANNTHNSETQASLITNDKKDNVYPTDTISHSANQRILATRAHDMWSVGCILYLLCTKETLFLHTIYDHIDINQLQLVANWNDTVKTIRLQKVQNLYARNLISQLLSFDPALRPSAMTCLQHPFFREHITYSETQELARFPGVKPLFDMFICYRNKTLQECALNNTANNTNITTNSNTIKKPNSEQQQRHNKPHSRNHSENNSQNDDNMTQNSELSDEESYTPNRNNDYRNDHRGDHIHSNKQSNNNTEHNNDGLLCDDRYHVELLVSELTAKGHNLIMSQDNANSNTNNNTNHTNRTFNTTSHNLCNSKTMCIVLSSFAMHYGTNNLALLSDTTVDIYNTNTNNNNNSNSDITSEMNQFVYEIMLAYELQSIGLLEGGIFVVIVGNRTLLENSAANHTNHTENLVNNNDTFLLDTLEENSLENSTIATDNKSNNDNSTNNNTQINHNNYTYNTIFKTYLGETLGKFGLFDTNNNTTTKPVVMTSINLKIADFMKTHGLGVPQHTRKTVTEIFQNVLSLPSFQVIGNLFESMSTIGGILNDILNGEVQVTSNSQAYNNTILNNNNNNTNSRPVTSSAFNRLLDSEITTSPALLVSTDVEGRSKVNTPHTPKQRSGNSRAQTPLTPQTTGQNLFSYNFNSNSRMSTPMNHNNNNNNTMSNTFNDMFDNTNHTNITHLLLATPKTIIDRVTSPSLQNYSVTAEPDQFAVTMNNTISNSRTNTPHKAQRPNQTQNISTQNLTRLHTPQGHFGHITNNVTSYNNINRSSSRQGSPQLNQTQFGQYSDSGLYSPARIGSPSNEYKSRVFTPNNKVDFTLTNNSNDVQFYNNDDNNNAQNNNNTESHESISIPYFTDIVSEDKHKTSTTLSVLVSKLEQKDNIIMNLEMEIALLREQVGRTRDELNSVREKSKVV